MEYFNVVSVDPRFEKYDSSKNAASYGAGGNLYGNPEIIIAIFPCENVEIVWSNLIEPSCV